MKKQHVKLLGEDKKSLDNLLSKRVQKVRIQKRARVLQMLNKGMPYQEVKTHLNVSYISLSKWAKHYKTEGLKMLYDKPRSGRPVGLSGEEYAKITALACSTPPKGYAG